MRGRRKEQGHYSTRRVYLVIGPGREIVAELEVPVKIEKDWNLYLNGKSRPRQLSAEEQAFLEQWQGKRGHVVHTGMADSMAQFVDTQPELFAAET